MSEKRKTLFGYEIIITETKHYMAKILHISANKKITKNKAKLNTKEKTILVQYGRVQIEHYRDYSGIHSQKIITDLVPGDSFKLLPGLCYEIRSCQDSEILEISDNSVLSDLKLVPVLIVDIVKKNIEKYRRKYEDNITYTWIGFIKRLQSIVKRF